MNVRALNAVECSKGRMADEVAGRPRIMPISGSTSRLIRLKEVLRLVPLGRSTIYERMEKGVFPRSRDLGGGIVAWRECDILAWIDGCPETGQEDVEK